MKKVSRKFRLATVLKIAKAEEEKQQMVTADALRVREAAAALEAAREAAYAAREAGGSGPVSTALFEQLTQSAQLKAEALHVAHNESIDAATRVELAREELAARARKTHTLEDLEERHNVAYAVHAALAAQRTLDDLVRFRKIGK
ncbi:MAG: hypothetical protein Q8K63_08545 [Acidimicrobiales bacterium]|nr:hypothetical protein [Acidimicrobiales bacterium]